MSDSAPKRPGVARPAAPRLKAHGPGARPRRAREADKKREAELRIEERQRRRLKEKVAEANTQVRMTRVRGHGRRQATTAVGTPASVPRAAAWPGS